MTLSDFIQEQAEKRRELLAGLHHLITGNDNSVIPAVESMMGKQMILYKERGIMKYGLAVVKKYMSLHCMPIYMNPVLHTKYAALLPLAKLQKGCVNFTGVTDLPLEIVSALITDCSTVSIADMLENRKKK